MKYVVSFHPGATAPESSDHAKPECMFPDTELRRFARNPRIVRGLDRYSPGWDGILLITFAGCGTGGLSRQTMPRGHFSFSMSRPYCARALA